MSLFNVPSQDGLDREAVSILGTHPTLVGRIVFEVVSAQVNLQLFFVAPPRRGHANGAIEGHGR